MHFLGFLFLTWNKFMRDTAYKHIKQLEKLIKR